MLLQAISELCQGHHAASGPRERGRAGMSAGPKERE